MGSRLSIRENEVQDTEYKFHGGIAPDANVTVYLCSGWPSSIVSAFMKSIIINKTRPWTLFLCQLDIMWTIFLI